VMASALRGDRERVLHIMTPELRTAAMWDDIYAWWTADCFALVNEREDSMDYVERAIEFGYVNYHFLAEHEPFLANVRGEPRFARLMERVRGRWNAFEA